MPRGGRRQGIPGKGYSNRTDLAQNYEPGNAAAGGIKPQPQRPPMPMPMLGADDVPNIFDPTGRPNEPVTAGLSVGPGAGPEALGPMPPPPADPVRQAIQAMLLISPNPDLVRVLNRLDYEGR